MQKFISVILFTSLFLLLQYGKITNYFYCEWQTAIVLSLPDCDCDKLLNGVFDGDHSNTISLTDSKEKVSDYIPSLQIYLPAQPLTTITSYFASYPQILLEGDQEPAFRPPAS